MRHAPHTRTHTRAQFGRMRQTLEINYHHTIYITLSLSDSDRRATNEGNVGGARWAKRAHKQRIRGRRMCYVSVVVCTRPTLGRIETTYISSRSYLLSIFLYICILVYARIREAWLSRRKEMCEITLSLGAHGTCRSVYSLCGGYMGSSIPTGQSVKHSRPLRGAAWVPLINGLLPVACLLVTLTHTNTQTDTKIHQPHDFLLELSRRTRNDTTTNTQHTRQSPPFTARRIALVQYMGK